MATLSMDALATHGLNAAEHIFSALDANHDGKVTVAGVLATGGIEGDGSKLTNVPCSCGSTVS